MQKDKQHSEEELLITRFLSSEATNKERDEVIDLLGNNAEFKELYFSILQGQQDADSLLFFESINEDKAFAEICKKANISFEPKAKSSSKIIKLMLQIAAVLLIGAFITYQFTKKPEQISISATNHILAENELPDGSTISLNKKSTIEFTEHFGLKNRNLLLTGEAYFSVKPGDDLPFIIDCKELTIEVIGTEFYVENYEYSDKVMVYVKTGKVKIYDDAQVEILNSGDKLEYDRNTKIFHKKQEGQTSNSGAWLNKTLFFEDCPIQDVINQINKFYGVDIAIEIQNADNCRLSATFNNTSLENALEMICLSLGLTLVNKTPITLKGTGC